MKDKDEKHKYSWRLFSSTIIKVIIHARYYVLLIANTKYSKRRRYDRNEEGKRGTIPE